MATKVEERMVILREFGRDATWVSKNADRLRKKYPDKFIAVRHYQVLDSDKDIDKLRQRIIQKYGDIAPFVIDFIGAEKPELIL